MAESLAALAALERLFACVQPLVFGQVVLVLKSLFAHVAHKGPYARVFVLVARQRGLFAEHFVTLVAGVHVAALHDMILPGFSVAVARTVVVCVGVFVRRAFFDLGGGGVDVGGGEVLDGAH